MCAPVVPATVASGHFEIVTKDNGEMWRLLNLAAWEIGVNRSALVKQLDLEGRIIVEQKGGRKIIHLQPAFSTLMGGR